MTTRQSFASTIAQEYNREPVSSERTKKKVSFGPCVTVKEIPFYANEDLHRIFYTDEEYDKFEAAEQKRMDTIRQLYQEYKRQYRLMTLQVLLQAEGVAPLASGKTPDERPLLASQQCLGTKKRTRIGEQEHLAQQEGKLEQVSSKIEESTESASHPALMDTMSSNGCVHSIRLAKRRRTSSSTAVCTVE